MRILEVLAIRGLTFRRSSSNTAEVNICCPFPGCEDTRYRLGLNVVKNIGHCYNCDWKAGKAAIQKILRQLRIEIPRSLLPEETAEKKEGDLALPEDFTLLHDVHNGEGELYLAKRYLLDRGVTSAQMRRHFIGCSLSGRYSYRIVVPITFNGFFLGTVCRDFGGCSDVRYLNSNGGNSLWNASNSKFPRSEPMVLAEGIFKALAVERVVREEYSALHPAALNGSAITEAKIEQLREGRWEHIFLLPDPDAVGLEKALVIAGQLLAAKFKVYFPQILPLQQADNMKPGHLSSILRSKAPFTWVLEQQITLQARRLA